MTAGTLEELMYISKFVDVRGKQVFKEERTIQPFNCSSYSPHTCHVKALRKYSVNRKEKLQPSLTQVKKTHSKKVLF